MFLVSVIVMLYIFVQFESFCHIFVTSQMILWKTPVSFLKESVRSCETWIRAEKYENDVCFISDRCLANFPFLQL